jgi:hypothetical protein
VDPSVHNVYVTNSADKVTVFDGLSNTNGRTVTVGPYIQGIGVDSIQHRAYVVARGSDFPISSVDGKMYVLGFNLSGPVVTATIPIEENVVGVAVDESANRVYLAHSQGIVTIYTSYTLARLATVTVIGSGGGKTVTGIAVDSGTHVTHVIYNDISMYTDYGHWSKIEWTGTAYAETDDVAYPDTSFDAVAVDSSSHTAFISDSARDRVGFGPGYFAGYVSVGNPSTLAVDSTTHSAYVFTRLASGNTVKLLGPRQTVNGPGYSVLASIPVSNPQGIAADSSSHYAHVSNWDTHSVVRVTPTPTTVTLTALPAAAVAGVTPVTMTASVSPGTANGTVQFYEVDANYQSRPSGAPVAVNGGATVSAVPTPAVRISTIGAGTRYIYAVFIPNNASNYQSAQALVPVTLL